METLQDVLQWAEEKLPVPSYVSDHSDNWMLGLACVIAVWLLLQAYMALRWYFRRGTTVRVLALFVLIAASAGFSISWAALKDAEPWYSVGLRWITLLHAGFAALLLLLILLGLLLSGLRRSKQQAE